MKKKFYKKPLFYVPAILIILIIGVVFLSDKNGNKFETIAVQKKNLFQEVNVSGKVVAISNVNLSFEMNGKIASVPASVGEEVIKDDVLVRLENSEIYARLLQAGARYESELAKLEKIKIGQRPEEIEIIKAKVSSAEISLNDAKNSLFDKIGDAYSKADDAIRNKVDQFIDNPRGSSPKLSFVADQQKVINIESQRPVIEAILVSWKQAVDSFNVGGDIISLASTASNNLAKIIFFLDDVSFVVNSLSSSSNLSSATIVVYKTDVQTARANVNIVQSNLSSAIEKFRNAESALVIAKNELILSQAGSTFEDIKSQNAVLKSAEASVAEMKSMLSKSVIKAPFSGIVTIQNAKVGEVAYPNTNIVSLMGKGLEIEAFIPESDIAKVSLGNNASVVLDAYDDLLVLNAEVISVDPAETMLEGIATYKIKLRFMEENMKVKSGMTANVKIITNKKEDVISIPQRAIISKEGISKVKMIENGKIIEKEIVVGMKSSDGNTEVIKGLSLGESVIVDSVK